MRRLQRDIRQQVRERFSLLLFFICNTGRNRLLVAMRKRDAFIAAIISIGEF